jgi:hypothetical protein
MKYYLRDSISVSIYESVIVHGNEQLQSRVHNLRNVKEDRMNGRNVERNKDIKKRKDVQL